MKAIVNNSFEFTFDDSFRWDCIEVKDNQFHILYKNQSYVANVVSTNFSEKTVEVLINNRSYLVALQDKFDLLLDQLGMTMDSASKDNDVKAPMPGRILDVLVSEGKPVSAGDSLIVLEAMKMENVIKSPRDGTIKAINVSANESVEKNTVLLSYK